MTHSLIIQNPGVLLENAIKRFIDEIRRDPKEGWEYLEKFDRYSVRQFLAAYVHSNTLD